VRVCVRVWFITCYRGLLTSLPVYSRKSRRREISQSVAYFVVTSVAMIVLVLGQENTLASHIYGKWL